PVLPAVRVNPELDWGPSDFDVHHTLSGGLTYAIQGPGPGEVWRAVLRRGSMDAVFVVRSSLPLSVLTGTTAFGVSNALRPDTVSGVPFYLKDPSVPGGRPINRAAFTAPPLDASGNPLRQGTLVRNALRGFAMNQLDLGVRRDIPIGERMNIQLRAEAFN